MSFNGYLLPHTTPSVISTLQPPDITYHLAAINPPKHIGDSDLQMLTPDPAGGAAFIGLGAYTYLSSTRQLEAQRDKILKSGSRFGLKSRRFGVLGLSATLVGMGLYRFVN